MDDMITASMDQSNIRHLIFYGITRMTKEQAEMP